MFYFYNALLGVLNIRYSLPYFLVAFIEIKTLFISEGSEVNIIY